MNNPRRQSIDHGKQIWLLSVSNRIEHYLVFCLCVLTSHASFAQTSPKSATEKYAIVIHGGAGGDPGKWSASFRQQRYAALERALERGVDMLADDAAALDVVEKVVNILEDNPVFNAGRGCVLNEQGEHELDASIMDGSTLHCGAVGSVRRIKNPVSLARQVMQNTRHILLIGDGADKYGASLGLETAEDDYFRTAQQLEKWRAWKKRNSQAGSSQTSNQTPQELENYFGTVGCVVLDRSGNLAAATSTGGLLGKRWGRVGDSPIIGAGTYANNDSGAVSGTGIGEEFIRHNVAADIAARMRYANVGLAAAAEQTIKRLPRNGGGIIAVDADGNIAMEFNTAGMSRAFATSDGKRGIRFEAD